MMKKIMCLGVLLIATMSCKKNAEASGSTETSQDSPTETVRFINGTYAVLTEQNQGDYNLVGGHELSPENTAACVAMLKSMWEINNLADGTKAVDELSGPGMHNPEFLKAVKDAGIDKMDQKKFDEELAKITSPDDKAYFTLLYKAYSDLGENALVGWDLGRANFLIANFYLTKFYDQNTALDKGLEVSKKIQKTFKSWDEFNKSYMYGYEFWSGDKPGSPKYEAKMSAIKKLQDDSNSPYHVDWKVALKKDWK